MNTDLANADWRSRGEPDPIDIHVGGRARSRRIMLGLSQEAIAGHLGISFQQLQKYESGTNRISASRLFDLAHGLSVEIGYFFDDLPADLLDISRPTAVREEEALIDNRVVIELVRHFSKIPSARQRQTLLELIRLMAADGEVP